VTPAAFAALLLAAFAAVIDWWAVATDRRRVEYAAKPAVLVALTAAALFLEPADAGIRLFFVIGLCFGLLGDVLLMVDRFIPGAAAFLVGHLAYIGGLLLAVMHATGLLAGTLVFLVTAAAVGRPIVIHADRRSRKLGVIVTAYLAVMGGVLVLGFGSAVPAAVAGVSLFAASDALLAWGRFVGPAPGGRTLVHMTYHTAQGLLVLSLLQL
jgi:alkenylglycerophosphocholine/alkenylglycerophosphoethanolamine hydrolase